MLDSAVVGTQTPQFDAELCLPENYRSAALARQFVRTMLTRWAYAGRHDDVVLVTSELVGNALLHASGPPVLRLLAAHGRIRVEVSDHSSVLPAVRQSGPVGGWGLHLVERLAVKWGAARSGIGKVVWCEIEPRPAPASVAA